MSATEGPHVIHRWALVNGMPRNGKTEFLGCHALAAGFGGWPCMTFTQQSAKV
jgi:hypothetical protein